MKKTNQLLFIAGLSIAALCGCQYDAALKQQNARTVAKLEYNLSYTQTPKEQIAIAAEILTIDNNNNTALNVMMSFFNKPEFQKEIADNFYKIAEKNLDNSNLFNIADASAIMVNIPDYDNLEKLNKEFIRYQYENDKIDKDFIREYAEKLIYMLAKSSFDDCEFAELIIKIFEKNYDQLSAEEQRNFDLKALIAYDTMAKNAPAPKFFWNRNLKKAFAKQREFYLDKVINNRKNYLMNEEGRNLVHHLTFISEFEWALYVADDYKNIEGIDENDKLFLRTQVLNLMGKYHKSYELLQVLRKNKFEGVEAMLISVAAKIGKQEESLAIAKELYEKSPAINTAAIYCMVLLENDKFDDAKNFVNSYMDTPLNVLSLKMYHECYLRKYTHELQQQVAAAIKEKKLFTENWGDEEVQTFVDQALSYLCLCQNRELMINLISEVKKTPAFYRDSNKMNTIGYIMACAKLNLDEAIELIKKAIHSGGYELAFIDSLAWGYYNNGNYIEAKKYIDLLLANKNYMFELAGPGLIYLHAGDIYRANGLEAEALDFYEKAANCEEDIEFRYEDLKQRTAK